jgi:hypothetical protein
VVLLIGSYLLLMFVLPLLVSGSITYRALPTGCRCTVCGGDTIPLASRLMRLASAVNPHSVLQRRWCLCCGREAVVRRPRVRLPLPPAIPGGSARGRVPSGPPPAGSARRTPTQTLDVRALDVDGAPWRVMLQCWTARDLTYGRLLFVSPSGRLWLDAVETISAGREGDVLGQARSLPEPVLARRLKQLSSRRPAG